MVLETTACNHHTGNLQKPGFLPATELTWDLRPARTLSSGPARQESRTSLEDPESFQRCLLGDLVPPGHLRPGVSETFSQ